MESEESGGQSSDLAPKSYRPKEPASNTQNSISPTSENVHTCSKVVSGSSLNNENSSSPTTMMSKSGGGDAAVDTDDPLATPESSLKGETVENTITLRKSEPLGPESKTWSFPWPLCRTWSVSVKCNCSCQPR